jgi:hypothetical protein
MSPDDDVIQAVWNRARAIDGRDASQWRQDRCGAWLFRAHYGQPDAEFGWTILDIQPGEAQDVDGLEAFHVGNGFDVAGARARCRVAADRAGLEPNQWVDPPRNKHD